MEKLQREQLERQIDEQRMLQLKYEGMMQQAMNKFK